MILYVTIIVITNHNKSIKTIINCFFLNQQFIIQSVKANCGSYFVTTYIETKITCKKIKIKIKIKNRRERENKNQTKHIRDKMMQFRVIQKKMY